MVFTKWVCYNGKVGVTESGEYYEMESCKLLTIEHHAGALYYRSKSSNKRYSWAKCNRTKVLKRVEIIDMPF